MAAALSDDGKDVLWDEGRGPAPAARANPRPSAGTSATCRPPRSAPPATRSGARRWRAAVPEPPAETVGLRCAEAGFERRANRKATSAAGWRWRCASSAMPRREAAPEVRAEAGHAAGTEAARAGTRGARARPAVAAEIPDGHLGGRHHSRRLPRPQGGVGGQHRARHHGGAIMPRASAANPPMCERAEESAEQIEQRIADLNKELRGRHRGAGNPARSHSVALRRVDRGTAQDRHRHRQSAAAVDAMAHRCGWLSRTGHLNKLPEN